MHPTMTRLYQAALELKGWRGQSEIARRLGDAPQTLNNWETRGMSKRGMLAAQEVIGCSALWLANGKGGMRASSNPISARRDSKLWDQIVWLWDNADDEVLTMFRILVNAAYIKKQQETAKAQTLHSVSTTEDHAPPHDEQRPRNAHHDERNHDGRRAAPIGRLPKPKS